MYYLVSVDHNGMAVHLTGSDWLGRVLKVSVSNAVDETDNGMLWNDSEENGNVRSWCEELKSLTVEMKTVTLIGNSR
jgi:hypothetical protein